MKPLFDFDTAQQQFAGAFAPLAAAASLPVADAAGHVLATPLTAVLDQPPADQSAMDGYAVRHADLAHGEPLRVAQRCYAGDTPAPLAPRTAARLFTGSLIPPGADTVVMQEHAHEQDGGVTFDAPQRIGSHIRRRGEEVRAGDLLVPAGVRMGAMLAALAAGTGADVAMSLHAADTPAAVERALRDLHARCDLVICVGGASVGDKDLLRPALTALGASFLVTGVRMKPGKPVALARLDARPVVLLPGNPGAAMTAFALFVAPLIRRLQGRDACLPVVPSLPIDTGFEPDAQRERFVRVRRIVGADGAPMLDTLRQQGAGTLQSLVQATGLARLPAGRTLARGDAVPYYEFAPWLA